MVVASKGRSRSGQKEGETEKPSPSSLKLALGDCIATCTWVVGSSIFGEVAERLHVLTGFSEAHWNIALLVVGLALLSPVCSLLWGAMINPVNHVATIVSGRGDAITNVLRMSGQLVGAVIGSAIATSAVPEEHRGKFHMLAGKLQDGLAMELGFACEAALVFVSTLVFLYLTGTSQKSGMVNSLVPHLTTIFVCVIGAEFTGPSLNPYLSFAWNTIYQQHSPIEHVAVFWGGPCVGAIVAALLWRAFGPSSLGDAEKRSSRSKAAGRAAAKALGRVKKD